MRIGKQRVTCGECKHVFDCELVFDCPLAVAVAAMNAARCEKCGSDKIGLGGNYDGAPPLTAPLAARIGWWETRGERGTSSNTIYAAFMGTNPPRNEACYPLDPDDFRRCKLLLDLIPEWRSSLSTVTERYPWFVPMIRRWDEIERLFVKELPTGRAPECYALMQIARKECDAIRHAKVSE